MRFRIWPRTIRYQLLGGLVLLEALSLSLFGFFLVWHQQRAIHQRAEQRLAHQASSLVLQAVEGLGSDRPESSVAVSIRMMGEAPSVSSARITDLTGKVLYSSLGDPAKDPLTPGELVRIPSLALDRNSNKAVVFADGAGVWESVKPITFSGKPFGYAWVKTDRDWDLDQLRSTIQSTTIFGLIWVIASILLGWLLERSITRPLDVLNKGTKALMQLPDGPSFFPLPVVGKNEISDLIVAFNRMVASLEEQRSGLSDTLSLLDSMLANAPIGLAFFDSNNRFVRVNRVFSDATGLPLSRHLGRTLPEVMPASVARQLELTIQAVFTKDEPVRDVEVTAPSDQVEWPAMDLDCQCLPGSHRPQPGALGGPDRDGCQRTQAQRRGAAKDRKAGRYRQAGRLDRA